MPRIHRLPDVLANQIAAGEVIERPANAAKELVDNALDAGARRIEIVVREGGRYLQVVDDGYGMAPEDLPMAFERFATSKVRTLEDLETLQTMGFRGEALAALGAVARVTLRSRPVGQDEAWAVTCAMGELGKLQAAAGAAGTSVQVEDLFEATPARRKFLRSDPTEQGHVLETVTALALAHPTVAFRVTINGRTALATEGSGDLATVMGQILGGMPRGQLLPIAADSPAGHIRGFLCPPEMIRGDRSRQWLFINGRPVRHPALARAVDEALAGHIPPARHPIYVLDLEVEPRRVDFNVHPTKREVRLADAGAWHGLIRQAVGASLRQALPSPVVPLTPAPSWQESRVPSTLDFSAQPAQNQLAWPGRHLPHLPEPEVARVSPASPPVAPQPSPPPAAGTGRSFPWDDLRLVGQLHLTYLIAIHPDGILLIDQHNAHERFLYEQLGATVPTSQALLIPQPTGLPPALAGLMAEHRDAFETLGFAFDDRDHLVAVPALLPEGQGPATLARMLEQVREGGELAHLDPAERWRVTLACHSATKAGDTLDPRRMEQLLALWRRCEQPFTCPHGRPTSVLVSMDELHRRCLRGMQTR